MRLAGEEIVVRHVCIEEKYMKQGFISHLIKGYLQVVLSRFLRREPFVERLSEYIEV